MTWAKLSDDYSDDCWTLSDAAFRLHTEALVWNGRKLLDCRIPKDDLRRFAKNPDAAPELLDVGWWDDGGDVYVIRHHAQYQRTREAVVTQQAVNARNGAKGGRPRKPREQATPRPKTQPVTEPETESPREAGTERDGPGRAGSGREKRKYEEGTQVRAIEANEDSWAAEPRTGCAERLGGGVLCGLPKADGARYCDAHLAARTHPLRAVGGRR